MTDLHTHILPFVDDGCADVGTAVALLEEEKSLGVDTVALTPHYRGNYRAPVREIRSAFAEFCELQAVRSVGVKLCLGREIQYDKRFISRLEKGNVITLGGGKYVLIELPYDEAVDAEEIAYGVRVAGYKAIFAHVERFDYVRDEAVIKRLKRRGALIQVNARSIVDRSVKEEYRFARRLIRARLVDVVASDVHAGRKNYMKAAYEAVAKRDREYAERIFDVIPKVILRESTVK